MVAAIDFSLINFYCVEQHWWLSYRFAKISHISKENISTYLSPLNRLVHLVLHSLRLFFGWKIEFFRFERKIIEKMYEIKTTLAVAIKKNTFQKIKIWGHTFFWLLKRLFFKKSGFYISAPNSQAITRPRISHTFLKCQKN